MQIIYVNKGASPSRFKSYLEKYKNDLQQQAQKYNQLLMEGLAQNGADVYSVSSRPITRKIDRKIFFKRETEKECGISYRYVSFINYSALRKLTVFFNVFFEVLFMKKKRKDTVVVCDVLNIAASSAAYIVAKMCNLPAIGIVTDVPCYRPKLSPPSLYERINLYIIKKFDAYLFLTKEMTNITNPKNRPFIVLEGHSDVSMADVKNTLEGKADKKICMYAGSLRRIYGIKNLVEGFIAAGVPDTELHIYGDGDYKNELVELCGKYDNIKYLGLVPNSEIVKAELRATLLVNPRPSGEEYTKYSFPSKNMEYMASGTPVLTTELPGMPDDHKPYVFLLKDESADGIAKELKNILSKTPEELYEKGRIAKEFVLKEKNNIRQAEKVIKFIKNM